MRRIRFSEIAAVLSRPRWNLVAVTAILVVDAAARLLYHLINSDTLTPYLLLDGANGILRDGLLLLLVDLPLLYLRRLPASRALLVPAYVYVVIDLSLKAMVIDFYRLPFSSLTILSTASGVGKDLLFLGIVYVVTAAVPAVLRAGVFSILYVGIVAISLVDTFYVYYASDHIEEVLFDNLNWAGVKGAVANWNLMYVGGAMAVVIVIFCANMWAMRRSVHAIAARASFAGIAGLCLFLACTSAVRYGALQLYGQIEEQIPEFLKDTFDTRLQRYDLLAASPYVNLYKALTSYEAEAKQGNKVRPFLYYDAAERGYLEEGGFIHRPAPAVPAAAPTSRYKTIVLIFFESLHADYLHRYNPNVPADATPFIDSLIVTYPHEDNYFTSASPTTFGLAATFLSHINFWYSYGVEKTPPSLFRVLEGKRGMDSYFITGASGAWGEQFILYPHLFGMKHFIDEEEMDKRYSGKSGWGYHDDSILSECLRLLKENRDRPKVIALKTQDLHNPGSYCGLPDSGIPQDVLHARTPLVKSMYWDDRCLENFFRHVKAEGLFTPDTLFVISADHSALNSVDLLQLLDSGTVETLGQIPLIFVSANTEPFRAMDSRKLASQVDLAPTLLQVMGLDAPANYMGRSLLEKGEGVALGYFQGTFVYKGKMGRFATHIAGEPILDADPRQTAMRKWFNNLYSASFMSNGYRDLYPE